MLKEKENSVHTEGEATEDWLGKHGDPERVELLKGTRKLEAAFGDNRKQVGNQNA